MDPTLALNTIDLSPILEILIGFVTVALTALLGVASNFIRRKTGVEVDLANNAMLNEAIERAVAYARIKVADAGTISTKSDMVALAASYAITATPKALKYFNITEDRVKEMIEARLTPDDLPE